MREEEKGAEDSACSTFLWCSRSSSVCDLPCSCFSKSEILRCGERRWREKDKEEEGRKKERGQKREEREGREVEEGEGKNILTN